MPRQSISRREFLVRTAGLAAGSALWPGLRLTRAEDAEPPRPNIVFIMADDLGAKELGCYGNQEHRTPNIDQLARTGTRFQTCWATPICSPSRVLVMTGRYGFRTGWNNLIGLPGAPRPDNPKFDIGANEVTFADVLKSKGYATALAGKWQLPGRVPTLIHDCGFDEYLTFGYKRYLPEGVKHTGRWEVKGILPARFWHPCILRNGEYVPTQSSDYGPNLYTDFLIDFIRRHRDQPFLAYYPMCLTHKPWEPTPSLDRPGEKTPGGLKHNVEYLDHLVGRIVEALDRFGLRKNTIVIFTGDNGTTWVSTCLT